LIPVEAIPGLESKRRWADLTQEWCAGALVLSAQGADQNYRAVNVGDFRVVGGKGLPYMVDAPTLTVCMSFGDSLIKMVATDGAHPRVDFAEQSRV